MGHAISKPPYNVPTINILQYIKMANGLPKPIHISIFYKHFSESQKYYYCVHSGECGRKLLLPHIVRRILKLQEKRRRQQRRTEKLYYTFL